MEISRSNENVIECPTDRSMEQTWSGCHWLWEIIQIILRQKQIGTRKPCCRKDTARCRSCSFQCKVRGQHSLQVIRVSKLKAPNTAAKHNLMQKSAKWPFRVIQGHVFWCQWKDDNGLSNTAFLWSSTVTLAHSCLAPFQRFCRFSVCWDERLHPIFHPNLWLRGAQTLS